MAIDQRLDFERLSRLTQREQERFRAMRPKSQANLERARRSMPRGVPMSWMTSLYHHAPFFVAEAAGIHFTDIDGNRYRDFNLGITAAFCGHNPEPTVAAASRQMARGSILQLPSDDAIWVAEELQKRYRQPKWQFTITASQANAELLLLARLANRRKKVLLFEGKYHGHVAPFLAADSNGGVVPEYRGIQAAEVRETLIVPFNDLDAVERSLRSGDVALILTEPAMTNCGLIPPAAGFHRELRTLARRYEALLAIDETQTQVCSYGGLSSLWSLESDALVIGKCMAGGIPLAAYGMSEQLASELEPAEGRHGAADVPIDEPALGGTMFANAVSMAACRANLESVMTATAYDQATHLASRLADGLRGIVEQMQLRWSIVQIGTRVWCCFSPQRPKNSREVAESDMPLLRDLQRVYLANRGIWDFGVWAGPIVGIPAAADDIDAYIAVWSELIYEVFG